MMAVVGTSGNSMPFVMDINSPSNADYVKHMLAESESINLYPKAEEELTEAEKYIKNLQESYKGYASFKDLHESTYMNREKTLKEAKDSLLAMGLYTSLVEPVLESQLATTDEKDIASALILSMVREDGADELMNRYRYQNIYLAEIAHSVDKAMESIQEGMDCKIKEGLSEKDICDIEDKDIKGYVVDLTGKIPKDVTDTIFKRVEGAVNDFIDDKKKNQFKIKKIYDDAKSKVDEYNQAKMAVDAVAQSDVDINGGMDADASVNDILNAKLDAQNQDDVAANNNPAVGPDQLGIQNGMTPQQEALSWARYKESEILDENYNVFDAMMRILVESTHKNDQVKARYLKENGKLNFQKLFNDTRAMYTVLESLNTINAIDVDESYLNNMLHEMYQDTEIA